MTKEFNLYYWLAQAPDKAVMARYFEGVLTFIAVSKLEATTQEEEGKLHTKLSWGGCKFVTTTLHIGIWQLRHFTTMKFDIIRGMDIMETHTSCMTTIITCWVYNPWNEFVQDNAPILLRIGKLQVYGVPHKWVFL